MNPSPLPLTPDTAPAQAPPIIHYENFPVASLLCPPLLRPAIAAIYHFARTADDLADEGSVDTFTRLNDLNEFRCDLLAAAGGQNSSARWAQVFEPLSHIMRTHHLPLPLLTALLNAFEQDVRATAEQRHYAQDADLLDYCTRSANPVGRLLLHLYGITDEASLVQSDKICTALQLINFWQDVSVDVARGRWYISLEAMTRFEVTAADFLPTSSSKNASRLIASYVDSARVAMLKGAPLACLIPGRAGWELRLVVQGGLRILDKIEALQCTTWRVRPKLTFWDAPVILWRALRMGLKQAH